MGRAPKVIGATLGCSAFAIACIAGLASYNPSTLVLQRALAALFLCYIVGYILGSIGELIVSQHMVEYAKKHPIPDVKPLAPEPILEVELAEDQSGAGVPLISPDGKQVAQVTQPAQTLQTNRKAA
ncbi:MAG: hypothetical protein U0570_06375 [Phycisphaerales bacterium]